jgi:hypothetical protein
MAIANFSVHVKAKKGIAVVRPPFDKATKGNGRVEVTNRTTADVIVNLPGGVFDDGGGLLNPNEETVTVKPGNANRLVRHVHATAADGAYDFKVFSLLTFSFAQANSDPEFIIEA